MQPRLSRLRRRFPAETAVLWEIQTGGAGRIMAEALRRWEHSRTGGPREHLQLRRQNHKQLAPGTEIARAGPRRVLRRRTGAASVEGFDLGGSSRPGALAGYRLGLWIVDPY